MRSNNNVQLFTLHFAGGNCYSFQFLRPYLPSNFEFHPIELPGRGKRINEKLLTEESEAVRDLQYQITSLRNDKPFLIFGHSMGAALGLRVTKVLEQLGDPPDGLIVAGNAGPGSWKEEKCRSKMMDGELKDELMSLGGVSKEILDNDDLFNFFAPIIRSDFKLLENGPKLSPDFKINSPLTAVMGENEATAGEIENWRNFTYNECKFFLLPGNHFFIYDHPLELIRIIKNMYGRPLVS